jgi:exodeoxyribonuclease VII small subunit
MSKKVQDVTFGEAMSKLESIVAQLEEDEGIGLEQSIALYEQGQALATDCQQRLVAAKVRLTEIAVPTLSSAAADPA